ncbi:precorrin-3B synthase [Microvirga sp. 2YAF29]|uniref:precorrin-3B synthase n=1 Tax=Microvirga sp. 2YAF29 TaxID=3233031 RepID=UPI003F94E735
MTEAPTIIRKGWCPDIRRPMATGDGLLVRLHPLAGRLTADQACLIAEVARRHGNGHLDITARGNLQIRGVREQTYPDLVALLDREGLVEPEGDGPSRLVMVSPLAGIDLNERIDTLALAQAIEEKTRPIRVLPAKFFVSVGNGGSLSLDRAGADLHLVPRNSEIIAFALSTPGGWNWIGETSLGQTLEAVQAILSGYAAMRTSGLTDARRLRGLHSAIIPQLVAQAQLKPTAPHPQGQPVSRAGVLNVGSSKAVLLALPFGRCTRMQLEQAASWSERFGTGEIRLSFTRGILIPGVDQRHLTELLDAAAVAGFVTDGNDPRLSLHACPGKPDCASALTSASADALRVAEACKGLLSQGVTLHVSGCAKGCAHPGKSDLTLIGRSDDSYDIVHQGCSRDATSLHLSVEEIMKKLSPLTTLDDLRSALQEKAR